MLWPKKIHTRNLITKKNSCGWKIPLPPQNFSNGPSLKRFVSAFRKRQMSVRSKESTIYFTFCKDFLCVTGLPPFLSFCTSKTKLKSPPKIISSHLNVRKCLRTFSKKKGSSIFGTYIFANVKVLLSVFMSTIVNFLNLLDLR